VPTAKTHRARFSCGSIGLATALIGICAVVTLGVSAAAANTYALSSPVVDVSAGPDPFATCTADDPAAQQTFSTLYPSAEPEPRADINPTNALNIVGAYHQDRWNNGGDRGLVSSATHDGGATWNRVVVPGITKCSDGIFDRASDPWVSFTPNGKLYGIWLVFDVFDNHNGILVSTSTNGGNSWSSPPVPLIVDDTNGNDKQSITADPYNSNNVYAVWDRFLSPPGGLHASDQGRFHARSYVQQIFFSRTTNGGASWEPARVIYNPGTQQFTIGSIINVLPNVSHDLVNGFVEAATQGGRFRSAEVAVIRSTDHGATWSKKAITVAPLDLSFPGPHDPDNNLPIRSGGLPDFAVDAASGRLYAVWEDDIGQPGIDEILFSQSSDGGFNWSTPVKINKTPTNIPAGSQQAFTPTVKVAANGTVGVTYYDLRENTAAPGLPTDYWLVHCHSACTSAAGWAESKVAGPFDEEQASFAGGYFVGDYEGLVTIGNSFGPFFGQAVSRAAGNPSDVYYTTLSPTP
jgi:hypothetical protein